VPCTAFVSRLLKVQYRLVDWMAQSEKESCWQNQLKEYFEVVDEHGNNVKLKCKQCLPANKILSAAKCTPANLFKHVEVSIFGSSL